MVLPSFLFFLYPFHQTTSIEERGNGNNELRVQFEGRRKWRKKHADTVQKKERKACRRNRKRPKKGSLKLFAGSYFILIK